MKLCPRVFMVVCLTVLVCVGIRPAFADELAAVTGRITDSQGLVVPNVKVEAININTNISYSGETNGDGLYHISSVPPGVYRVVVQKTGFAQIVKPGVELHVQDVITLNFSMRLGSVTESVTVEGGAPLLDTESAAVSTVVDRQFAENLPLNGRSFQTLITLTPGTVLTKTNFSEQGQFSVNGQRANANYFTVDGVSANIGVSAGGPLVQSAGGSLPGFNVNGGTNSLVSVDAMQEFRIQTSSFAPEFGRSPGGQISIVTRSGTNDFHGTLFEYFRNDALDANNWFANQRGLPKAKERQNDFGGVLGGPVIKNRTFFFFSYEGLRLRQPQTVVTIVPSVDSRTNAPASLQPFLNAYTIPNGAVFGNGFAESAASYSDPSSLNATSIRLDHAVTGKLSIFGRYSYSPSESKQRGFNDSTLSSISNVKLKAETLTLGGTVSITPKVSTDIRLNYSRNEAKNFFDLDNFSGAVPPSDSVLFPAFVSPLTSSLNFIIFGGRALIVGDNARNVQRQFNLVDNLSVTKGGHQLKFGVDYRWLSPINGPSDYAQVPFFFGIMGPGGVLSGAPLSTFVGANEQVTLAIKNFSAYGQDSWKIKPRLTLTYGLRWEVNPAPQGKDGKDLFTFQNLDNLAALTLAPQGTPLYETTYRNFAPRIGLAWQLSHRRGHETVLRGGFGIFYDLGSGSLGNAPIFFPYGRGNNVSGSFPLTTAEAAPPPFSLVPQLGGRIIISDRNLDLPRTYQWNITLERPLGPNQAVSASYVGAVGRRLLRQELLITPSFFQVSVTRNEATSDYHALQLQFQRRLSRGMQALASYTFSHSIDIASNDSAFNTGAGFVNPGMDRGSSDFDVRHTFSGALTYEIPNPSLRIIGKVFLNNWAIDAFGIARSATPVDLIGGFNFAPGGFFSQLRPDVVPVFPLEIDDPTVAGGRRFNPAAFQPPAGLQGTLGRNVLRGFGAWQVDFALRRQFKLGERMKLQFRGELFNVFNHPNFGDPVNSLFDPNFGRSTSMLGGSLGSGGVNGGFNPLYQVGGPRSVQFALKLQF